MRFSQRQRLKHLASCKFGFGSYAKRFVRDMAAKAKNEPEYELSEKQAAYLEKLFHQYRRQIPDHQRLCTICPKDKQMRLGEQTNG